MSSYGHLYGSDVRERSYWGGEGYSAWIDYSNALPAGLLQRFYVFAQPAANTDSIGTAISRIQIWRQIPSRSLRRTFRLVWQRRVLVLPCNGTHGALHSVFTPPVPSVVLLYSVSQKIPEFFWHFPQTVGNF